MKVFVMKVAILCMQIVYSIIKLMPVKRKVVFISRQANSPTLDFRLLAEKMHEMDPDTEVVILAKKLEGGIIAMLGYVFHMLQQMYHMATAKVVVVDGYCIAASVLTHKRGLKIVQIWHALSAVKCFGYQALDKAEGSSSIVAKTMKMHNNYDYVFCASHKTAEYFSKAFNTPLEKFEILGMPRVDYIAAKPDRNEEIYEEYPHFKDRETILYIPTFRKDEPLQWYEFRDVVDHDKYNVIIKAHPLDAADVDSRFVVDRKYGTYDLMKFADYIITDYSAVSVEASILNKPVLFYLYDYENYKETRGINIDPFEEVPSATSKSLKDIVSIIEAGTWSKVEMENFRNNYVETLGYSNSEKIAKRIIELIQEQ